MCSSQSTERGQNGRSNRKQHLLSTPMPSAAMACCCGAGRGGLNATSPALSTPSGSVTMTAAASWLPRLVCTMGREAFQSMLCTASLRRRSRPCSKGCSNCSKPCANNTSSPSKPLASSNQWADSCSAAAAYSCSTSALRAKSIRRRSVGSSHSGPAAWRATSATELSVSLRWARCSACCSRSRQWSARARVAAGSAWPWRGNIWLRS